MFLTKENGMRIGEEIKETIGRDVNIMDRTGTILASTDPKRIGQLHTIAKEILEQQLPVLEVAAGEEGPGAQQGVNLPIYVDGNCEGVIGITGPPDAVRDFGAIVKKMTEIMLTTMRQQEQSLLVEQARSLFLEEWLFAQDLDWAAFAERGALLDIDIREPKRIAILEYEPRGTAQPPELHGGRLLQMAQRYEGTSFVIRRLRRVMFLADVCFVLASLLMIEQVYGFLTRQLMSHIQWLVYVVYASRNWVALLLVGALLEMYTTHRISHELGKEEAEGQKKS